jgi:hypothetical protein
MTQRLLKRKSTGQLRKTEVERQQAVMNTAPQGLYERFRRGLLEYHSEVGPIRFSHSFGVLCDTES